MGRRDGISRCLSNLLVLPLVVGLLVGGAASDTGLLRHLDHLWDELIGDLVHLLIGGQSLQDGHGPAGQQGKEGRGILHLEGLGDLRIGRDVDTGELNAPLQGVDGLGQACGQGEEAVIGGYPEQNQNGEGGRGLNHGLETGLGCIDNVAAGSGRPSLLAWLGINLVPERAQVDCSCQRDARLPLPVFVRHVSPP